MRNFQLIETANTYLIAINISNKGHRLIIIIYQYLYLYYYKLFDTINQELLCSNPYLTNLLLLDPCRSLQFGCNFFLIQSQFSPFSIADRSPLCNLSFPRIILICPTSLNNCSLCNENVEPNIVRYIILIYNWIN